MNGRSISNIFRVTIFYMTCITGEGSDITLFQSTFMFYNLKHIYLELENNAPLLSRTCLPHSRRSGSQWAVRPDGRRIWKRWSVGAVRPFPNIIQERGTIINRSDPLFLFPAVWEISASRKACWGWQRGLWKWVQNQNDRAVNTSEEFSGSIKLCDVWAHHTRRFGNCGRGVMKSWKLEKNPTLFPSAAVGNICTFVRWKARSDTQSVYRKGCLLSAEICKMANAW